MPFDEERYSLIRTDGSTEVLTSDKFDFINGSTQIQIYNLGTNDTATLVATLRKINPKSKIKLKNRVSSLIIDRSKYEASGIGATTLDDGLIYGNYPYGTRVQDENISLNTPDIIKVYGIYESKTTSNPSSPTLVLSSISGPTTKTTDLIIGEQFIGQLSGAIGVCAERITDSQISFILLNENTFKEGETITFSESNIQAVITTIDSPSSNISSNFKFDNGTWLEITTEDLQTIIQAVDSKVQEAFDWELAKLAEIDVCEDGEAVYAVEITPPTVQNPVV